MNEEIPSVSLWNNLVYNLAYVVPTALQGTFTRNRFWVAFWNRVHPDPAAVCFVTRLRGQYRSSLIYVRLGTRRSLLVLGQDGVRHVLEHSPAIYADGKPKRAGMRVFQPHALTISRGDDWRERRRFNEAVLDSGRPLHRYADDMLAIVRSELGAATGLPRQPRTWDDFDRLFARIALQVIFGRSARADIAVTDLLRKMMRESNRLIKPKKSKHFEPFYSRIRGHLQNAESGSLVALAGEVPSTEQTRVENQVPHWIFPLWETLAANTMRALAAILAHPRAEARVREEMGAQDLARAEGVDRLEYLEACIQEAMRLWPTTPVLVRETQVDDTLEGATIPCLTQVLVWNSFNHRDRESYPLADTFSPEAWANGRPNPLFNHLSSGPQVCPGTHLLLFITKAVIATILDGTRYSRVRPALNPERPMPYAYNYFSLRFSYT